MYIYTLTPSGGENFIVGAVRAGDSSRRDYAIGFQGKSRTQVARFLRKINYKQTAWFPRNLNSQGGGYFVFVWGVLT